MINFDFGKNWEDFSVNALTKERVEQARKDFQELMHGIDLKNKYFLDIGFGQGLSSLIALSEGAIVIGCDINKKCRDVLNRNKKYFSDAPSDEIMLIDGSILDASCIEKLRSLSLNVDGYDIVHSWGVLHHTGDMRTAIENSASLVKKGGHYVISIYKRHWTSPFWRGIKKFYNLSPPIIQKVMVLLFYPIVSFAKFIVTGKDPFSQERGMDFFYDVIDWIGGYPYEYASKEEIINQIVPFNMEIVKFVDAKVPTGCCEYVFKRKK